MESLRELVPVLEEALERIYHADLNKVLLDNIPEGVVVTGPHGVIFAANQAARRRFFGRLDHDKNPLGTIEQYGADEFDRAVLGGQYADTYRRITLLGTDGQRHPVLANRNQLGAEFQGAVWFFADIDNLDWNVEYRYLRESVNQVAQQTRGPLIIASTLLGEIFDLVSNSPLQDQLTDLLEKTLLEIGKADITFERLAEGLAAAKTPMRTSVPVDLCTEVKRTVDAFPARDRKQIDLHLNPPALMNGDPGRLGFLLRSIIGYLVQARPNLEDTPTPIKIDVGTECTSVILELRVVGLPSSPSNGDESSVDPILRGTLLARNDSELGLDTIERIVAAHGGTLSRQRLVSDAQSPVSLWLAFKIKFPRKGSGE